MTPSNNAFESGRAKSGTPAQGERYGQAGGVIT
jgi:hypothetical protein